MNSPDAPLIVADVSSSVAKSSPSGTRRSATLATGPSGPSDVARDARGLRRTEREIDAAAFLSRLERQRRGLRGRRRAGEELRRIDVERRASRGGLRQERRARVRFAAPCRRSAKPDGRPMPASPPWTIRSRDSSWHLGSLGPRLVRISAASVGIVTSLETKRDDVVAGRERAEPVDAAIVGRTGCRRRRAVACPRVAPLEHAHLDTDDAARRLRR